jgi:hypothetical protein
MNNLFLSWLQENIQRFFTSSPLFFKWWQRISYALILITAVPEFLQMFDVELPPPFNTYLSKAVMFCSIGILWMARLASQSVPVAVTNTGEVLKKTDETKLPFTAKVEQAEVIKEGGVLNAATPTSTETVIKIDPPLKPQNHGN